MPDTLMGSTCPKCAGTLVEGKTFCPNCGLAVGSNASRAAIDPYIQAKISQELSARLKDQSSVVREIGDKAEDIVWARLKRYTWVVAAFVVVLGLWGIKSMDDATNKIAETARQRVEPIIQNTEARAKRAQDEISKTADQVTALDSTVSALGPKVGSYERRMREYEERLSKSGTQALGEVSSLQKSSATALNDIRQLRETVTRQQKELTETGALLKDLASRSIVEGFRRGQTPSGDFVTVTRTPASHALAMRLEKTPYRETVRVQWNTAVQPPDSYLSIGNVVILPYWEDAIDRLAERSIFVSYLADANPPPQTPFFKALSINNNAVLGDGTVLLPSLPPRTR